MKKWMVSICALAMVLSAMATPAHAARMACRQENGSCANRTAGCSFVDADNDGICDNKKNGCQNRNFTDADNDGVCDHKSAETCGGSFTDADGDGVCDNREERQLQNARGCRASGGRGRSWGKNR